MACRRARVWANAFVGHTLYRRFDRLNADDDIVPDDDTELPRSWMVRAGLSWRVPMP